MDGGINIEHLASTELIIQNIGVESSYLDVIEFHTYQENYSEKTKKCKEIYYINYLNKITKKD